MANQINISPELRPFIFFSGMNTFIGSMNSVLGTDNHLHALSSFKSRQRRTSLFVYKDVIGQLGGMGIALYRGKIVEGILSRGFQCITLQQFALSLDILLGKNPSWYIPNTCISNMLKNVAWVSLGAINARCFVDLSKKSNNDVAETYTAVNVSNTLSSSLGLYCGTKMSHLVRNLGRKVYMVSSGLYVIQMVSFQLMISSLEK
jgi:hypothetical protein